MSKHWTAERAEITEVRTLLHTAFVLIAELREHAGKVDGDVALDRSSDQPGSASLDVFLEACTQSILKARSEVVACLEKRSFEVEQVKHTRLNIL